MKKNLDLILGILAAVCFLAVFVMLFTGAAPATTALPFAIVGILCVLIATRDPREPAAGG